MELPKEVQSFINNLVPTDVGVDTVGDYIVHYEGFADECNDGHDDDSIQDVYAQVYQDFDVTQNAKPIYTNKNDHEQGVDCNPILVSVYKNVNEMYDQDEFDKIFSRRTKKNFNPEVRKYIDSKKWKLSTVNVADLDDEANDDNFGRVIDVDPSVGVDLEEPIYVHADGKTVLDGFHRVYQAKRLGKTVLPAMIPESKMNLKLIDKEISEARLFRTTSGFNQLTGESVSELLYLNTLITYLMYKDEKQHSYARSYAKQSTQYGKYTLFRSHATDLYLLAYLVSNPDSKSIKLRNNRNSKKYLDKLQFDKRTHWQFMFKLANGRISDTVASPYMFRLEGQLKIKKSMYKQWRRLIMDWENLKYIQRQSVTTRIVQELRRLGRGSEIMTPLTTMVKYKKYRVADKPTKVDPMRRFAGTAAGAVAGRYAGKKIAKKLNKNVDKYKKVGTGLGAIAGYWASGRQKQK